MSENIIEVNGLEYSYGNFKAVDNVSFFVRKGEIFSFLGPNGAGKSTVINILTTLLPLQKGTVRIAGYDLAKEPEQVRRSIGIVFQDETLDRDLTVWETLGRKQRLIPAFSKAGYSPYLSMSIYTHGDHTYISG